MSTHGPRLFRPLPPRCTAWIVVCLLTTAGVLGAAEDYKLRSPSGLVTATVGRDDTGALQWSLAHRGHAVILTSPLGVTLDGIDLGRSVELGAPTPHELHETYPWRGSKRVATNHARVYRFPIRSGPGPAIDWELEARVFNDGFAFRSRIPGQGARRVTGEASTWTLPSTASVWFQTNTGDYEGAYQQARADALPRVTRRDGKEWPVSLGPPVTAEIPDVGFALLTEANLRRYSGMTFKAVAPARLTAEFEDDPKGFVLEGEIVTPWRVTLVTPTLDGLVNSDLIPNLCDPPDPALFPQGPDTPWITPGRALVTWCVFGNDGAQWQRQKWFVDRAAALRHELLLVDAGWRTERWGWLKDQGDVWARLKELCDHAARRGVGIIVWHAYPEGRDDGPGLTRADARRELFARCADAGAQGVKIDFFNSESLEVIQAQEELVRLAAEHRLTINFHGTHKPTGESRTWPNEITREGLREQEYVLWDSLPLEHYTALPFTRMAVGHSDFLPAYVRPQFLRNTTATFQAALAIVATSSFVSWPDHPDDYLVSPLLGLLQAIPVAWDETRVLPGTAIGELAAFARRSGDDWFLAVLNGSAQVRTWTTEAAFLGKGRFTATLYREAPPHRSVVSTETGYALTVPAAPDAPILQTTLAPGAAFIAWIRPTP